MTSWRGLAAALAAAVVMTLGAGQAAQAGYVAAVPCAPGAALPCAGSGNDKESKVEAALELAAGTAIDLIVVAKGLEGDGAGFDFGPNDITDDDTFTWSYGGAVPLAYATVKGSKYFALFDIAGQSGGTLSLAGLVVKPSKGTSPDVSHVSFWRTASVAGVPVSEPGTLALVATALAAVVVLARRRRAPPAG